MTRIFLILAIIALVFTTINGQTAEEDDDIMNSDSVREDTKPENLSPGQEGAPVTDDSSKQGTPDEKRDNAEPEAKPDSKSSNAGEEASKQPQYVLVPAPNPFPNLGPSPFYIRSLTPNVQQPMGAFSHLPPFFPQPMGHPPPNHPLPYFPPPVPQYPFNQPQWQPPMPMPLPMPHPMMLPSQMSPMMMKPGDANQPAPQVILLNEQKNPEGTVTGQSAVYVKHDGTREVVIIKK